MLQIFSVLITYDQESNTQKQKILPRGIFRIIVSAG